MVSGPPWADFWSPRKPGHNLGADLKRIDIRDVMFLGGLLALGYGLYLKAPWVSFAVCGSILMVSGYIMRDKK